MLTFELDREELRNQWCVPAYQNQYKLSRLGEFYSLRDLGELASIRSGVYIREYKTEGLSYLRVDNVRPFQVNENPADLVFVSKKAKSITDRSIIAPFDVLIARTGTLGKASIALEKQAGAVMSQHLTRLTCSEGLLPGYLCCFLNSAIGRSQLISGGYGSTRLELTHDALSKVKIPIVENETCKRINKLTIDGSSLNNQANDTITFCISRLEKILDVKVSEDENLEIFQIPDLLDAQIWTPNFFRPVFNSALQLLEEKFVCVNLGEIADISRGKGTSSLDYVDHGMPFVRTTSLMNYGIDPFPDHYASIETYKGYKQPVKEGDILFSMEGKIGETAYILREQQCVYKNHIERIRCYETDPLFVFLFLNTAVGKMQAHKNTVIQATLPGMASRLREIRIPVFEKSFTPSQQEEIRDILKAAKVAFEAKSKAISKWLIATRSLEETLNC